ncbi:MAG: Coenzyme F420 hydrogenase/dehydrogenase, beta subunit C-terminal domain [Methanobacterium sp.]
MFEVILEQYMNKPLDEYINVYVVEPGEKYGGVITACLCYLLNKGFIDGVVSTEREGIKGKIVTAKTEQEIISSSGSVWHVVPYTLKMRETIENEGLYKLAIVGLPCQIDFLRQMKIFPLTEACFGQRLNFLISLFCYGTFARESVLNYINEKYDIEPLSIREIKITDKYLHVIGKKQVEIPIENLSKYLHGGCLFCPDYTGSASDLSVGIVEKKTIVIVRTKEMDDLIKDAAVLGYISIHEADEKIIDKIRRKAVQKINRARSSAI